MARPRRAPPRERRSDYRENRLRILEAARQIMAERGPEALTVSEVAHQAGLNRTTAYQHFRTRDELLAAVIEGLAGELASMMERPGPIEERMDFMAGYLIERPEIARLALHHLLAENPMPRSGFDRYVNEIRKLTAGGRGQPGVDAEMLAYVLGAIGILWPLVSRSEYGSDAEAATASRRLSREIKRLLLHGALRPEAWPELTASIDRDD